MNKDTSISLLIIIASIGLLSSCRSEEMRSIHIEPEAVVIKSANDRELRLQKPAGDSLLSVLRLKNLDLDSLWFAIEELDDSVIPPLPEGIKLNPSYVADDSSRRVIGPHYALFVSESQNMRQQYEYFLQQEKDSTGVIGRYLTTSWDLIVSVNQGGDRILRIE